MPLDVETSGSRGTLLCPGPLRTGRARFRASGSSKPLGRDRFCVGLMAVCCCLGGGLPPVAVGVKESVERPVLAVGLLDDVLLAQDPPDSCEPLLPLE